jgi:hypothetical protein
MQVGEPGYRLVLVGRALCAGVLWGAALGAATWAVLIVGSAIAEGATVAALLVGLLWSPAAAIIGGLVGATVALASGLALALSGNGVLRRTWRARLVTGSAAAAVPLAVAFNLHSPRSLADCLIAAGIAMAAVVIAVLGTPSILHGPPPPGKWQPGTRPAPQAPATRSEQ